MKRFSPSSIHKRFLVFAILAGCVMAVSLPGISKPFYGHHEFNGVFYSQIARNYLRLGLVKTKLAQVTTPQDVPQAAWGYHTHHPATYPLILAAAFSVGGVHESTARMVSIIATLISCYFFIKIAEQLGKSPFAALLIIPLMITPLWQYYSKLPVFEPILLPLTLGFYSAYLAGKQKTLGIFAALLVLMDWPGYWPIIIICLYEFMTTRKITTTIKHALIGLGIGSLMIIALQWISTGKPFTDLVEIGTMRVFAKPYTITAWIQTELSRVKAFFGLPILTAIVGGVIISLKNPVMRKMIIISGLAGCAHIFVFPNITWYHDYMLFHLIPFISIALIALFDQLSVMIIGVCSLSVATWWLTKPFYQALQSMTPHKDCYTIGSEARGSATTPTYYLSKDKIGECGPFVYYYADKWVDLKEQK
jgi:hypothetical protein